MKNGQKGLVLSINRQHVMDKEEMAIPLFFLPTYDVHFKHTWVSRRNTVLSLW